MNKRRHSEGNFVKKALTPQFWHENFISEAYLLEASKFPYIV